jgi:uncharacterized membrane protein YgcG
VRAGEGFSPAQRAALERSLSTAEASSGLTFVLHVGVLEGGRAGAEQLLGSGPHAADTVVVAVDPVGRGLEIVTGARAAHVLDDRTCALAALAMTSSFASGDLVGGIRNGLQVMGDHARTPPTRHISTF